MEKRAIRSAQGTLTFSTREFHYYFEVQSPRELSPAAFSSRRNDRNDASRDGLLRIETFNTTKS